MSVEDIAYKTAREIEADLANIRLFCNEVDHPVTGGKIRIHFELNLTELGRIQQRIEDAIREAQR